MGFYLGSKKIAGLYIDHELEHASEQHAGIIEIANSQEVTEGVLDSKAVTPLKLKQNFYNKEEVEGIIIENKPEIYYYD